MSQLLLHSRQLRLHCSQRTCNLHTVWSGWMACNGEHTYSQAMQFHMRGETESDAYNGS
jgi:hypothetical protein